VTEAIRRMMSDKTTAPSNAEDRSAPTLQRIADHCGVSVTTISRVLSGQAGRYRVSKKTEAAVRKLAAEHNLPKAFVLVIGSSNTDMVIHVEHIPKPGETILGGEFVCAPGGKGANQAVAAARAGAAVTFVARLGQDMFGEKAMAGFVAEQIDVSHVVRDKENPSGVALIFVGGRGENSIAVASGANARLSPADVRKAAHRLAQARVVLLQLESPLPTIEAAVKLAAAAGVHVILNPAPAQSLPDRLLKQVYLLTPNETEVELLSGVKVTNEASAARAAGILLRRGVQNVIITMGARGAFLAEPNANHFLPGYKVKAVDSTGAGDVFNGALAAALAQHRPLLEAARFASAAAAISVTRPGAQNSAPRRHEIDHFLATGRIQRNGKTNTAAADIGWNGWSEFSNNSALNQVPLISTRAHKTTNPQSS
jgi:ribokinase